MLTINQITKIFQQGVEVKIKKTNPDRWQGEFNPSTLEIILYTDHVSSEFDTDMTLLHEFVHARNSVLLNFKQQSDESIEGEALLTYHKRPYILEFIKNLYKLKLKK